MGHQVVYCCKCNIRLTQDQFESQLAYYFEDKTYCKGCLLKLWSSLPKARQEELWKKVTASAEPPKAEPAPEPKAVVRRPIVLSGETRQGSKLWIAVAGVIIVLVGLVIVVGMSKSPAPRPVVKAPPVEKPVETPIPNPVVPPPPADALDRAREYRKKNPNDLAGQIQKFRDAAFELEKTPRAAEAKKELELTLEERSRKWGEEFREIETKVKSSVEAESFKLAADAIRIERKRYSEGEWTARCDAKIKEIEKAAEEKFKPVKEEASAALKRGDRAAFDVLRKRVEAWGLDSFVFELAALDVPPEKPAYEFAFGASSLKPSAQFTQGDYPNVGKAWTCKIDLEIDQRYENYIEWEFPAEQGVEYQCHVYVGGCCQECVAVYWQCSELARTNAKKEKVSLEPGEKYYLSRKPSAASAHLPKKHVDHPKEPSFWEWRTLESPLFSAPGVKKFRVLTNLKGFSVAYVVISSTTKEPPQNLDQVRKLIK